MDFVASVRWTGQKYKGARVVSVLDLRNIMLTQGVTAIVDAEDYDFLNQWNWYNAKGYAVRDQRLENGDRKTIYMHRVIAKTPEHMYTDHINRNRADNRKSNLRICTSKENSRNVDINKNNVSGYVGVSWEKDRDKWKASIGFDCERWHLGLFDCKHEAAYVYNLKAAELHGEFAALNEIPNEIQINKKELENRRRITTLYKFKNGEEVKEIISDMGLSRTKLASLVEVSNSALIKAINREATINVKYIDDISRLLGKDVNHLFEEIPAKRKRWI